MAVAFAKMHGLGNDFVVLALDAATALPEADTIRALAARRTGVGFDQLMVITHVDDNVHYRVFNADGGEVEQCGNGARCVARYALDHGLVTDATFQMCSQAGAIAAEVKRDAVSINLGVPRFTPHDLPFEAAAEALTYHVDVAGKDVTLGAVSVGNPHAVIQVDDVSHAPLETVGAALESHPRFAQRVNVGFVEITSRRHCRLRVYERGVGETPACGTGATAAAVWAMAAGLLDEKATVSLTGGDLSVAWAGRGEPVWLTGPATPVFEGTIEL